MITIPTLSNVIVHRDTQFSSFTSLATTTPSVSSPRLTSSQSSELGKVLIYLDDLEAALKSSSKSTTETLVESVNASASVQSSVIAINADIAIGQTQSKSANLVVNGSFEEGVINRNFQNRNRRFSS